MLSRPVSRAYSKNRLLLGESLKISLTLVKEEFPGKLEFEVAYDYATDLCHCLSEKINENQKVQEWPLFSRII